MFKVLRILLIEILGLSIFIPANALEEIEVNKYNQRGYESPKDLAKEIRKVIKNLPIELRELSKVRNDLIIYYKENKDIDNIPVKDFPFIATKVQKQIDQYILRFVISILDDKILSIKNFHNGFLENFNNQLDCKMAIDVLERFSPNSEQEKLNVIKFKKLICKNLVKVLFDNMLTSELDKNNLYEEGTAIFQSLFEVLNVAKGVANDDTGYFHLIPNYAAFSQYSEIIQLMEWSKAFLKENNLFEDYKEVYNKLSQAIFNRMIDCGDFSMSLFVDPVKQRVFYHQWNSVPLKLLNHSDHTGNLSFHTQPYQGYIPEGSVSIIPLLKCKMDRVTLIHDYDNTEKYSLDRTIIAVVQDLLASDIPHIVLKTFFLKEKAAKKLEIDNSKCKKLRSFTFQRHSRGRASLEEGNFFHFISPLFNAGILEEVNIVDTSMNLDEANILSKSSLCSINLRGILYLLREDGISATEEECKVVVLNLLNNENIKCLSTPAFRSTEYIPIEIFNDHNVLDALRGNKNIENLSLDLHSVVAAEKVYEAIQSSQTIKNLHFKIIDFIEESDGTLSLIDGLIKNNHSLKSLSIAYLYHTDISNIGYKILTTLLKQEKSSLESVKIRIDNVPNEPVLIVNAEDFKSFMLSHPERDALEKLTARLKGIMKADFVAVYWYTQANQLEEILNGISEYQGKPYFFKNFM